MPFAQAISDFRDKVRSIALERNPKGVLTAEAGLLLCIVHPMPPSIGCMCGRATQDEWCLRSSFAFPLSRDALVHTQSAGVDYSEHP
jgi:hypothetical protein